MIEMSPWAVSVLAFPDVSQIFYYAVKVVMVVAGVLVGWFAGGAVIRVLVRLAFQRETPRFVQILSKLAFAVLVGYLAYLIPIGGGGPGGFFGGKGKDSGDKPGTSNGDKPSTSQDKPGRNVRDQSSRDEILSVRVLGGEAVKPPNFYQATIAGQDKTLTRDDLRKIIEQDQAGAKRYKRLEIHLDEHSVLTNNPVVTHLEDLGRKHKLAVRVIRDIPPDEGEAVKDKD
jgi:hypothetical protein